MGYVGVPPQSGFITTAKQRVTSSTNNYVDLDHSISSLADVIVWVNFIKQDSTNLTLTTSTRITLGGTLVSSDIVEIAYLGKAVATQTPSSGTVTNDMLSGSIANSKLSNSSITLNGSAVSLGGSATVDNTPNFLLNQSSTTTVATATYTKVNIDNAVIDTASGLDTTNKRWVVPSGQGGTYSICYAGRIETGDDFDEVNFQIRKNGTVIFSKWGVSRSYDTFTGSFLVVLSATDYLEMFVKQSSGSNKNVSTTDQGVQTFFGGYKLT